MVVKKIPIHFIATNDQPFHPGHGGTETFTLGLIRELHKRGYPADIVNVGVTQKDGRDLIPDVSFIDLQTSDECHKLSGRLISMYDPLVVPADLPGYLMVHVPPKVCRYPISDCRRAAQHLTIIATSRFTKEQWAKPLGTKHDDIKVLYPFADPAFAAAKRQPYSGKTRVLFAGRIVAEKGIYLFLEALHHHQLQKDYSFTVVTAGPTHTEANIITELLRHHPMITLTVARTSPKDMANLLAATDILVMPSNHTFWQESFGMLSIEAQHAGCRVVATNTGGLPETDIGGLYLFEPGDSYALAEAINNARKDGQIVASARKKITQQLTLTRATDDLLTILGDRVT